MVSVSVEKHRAHVCRLTGSHRNLRRQLLDRRGRIERWAREVGERNPPLSSHLSSGATGRNLLGFLKAMRVEESRLLKGNRHDLRGRMSGLLF